MSDSQKWLTEQAVQSLLDERDEYRDKLKKLVITTNFLVKMVYSFLISLVVAIIVIIALLIKISN